MSFKELKTVKEAVNAIKTMEVRGAPLIGATAAYGLVLSIIENKDRTFFQKSATDLINSKQLEGETGMLLKKKIPLKRFATADELDVIISMLLNPLNTYMTGAIIAVDGGLSTGL